MRTLLLLLLSITIVTISYGQDAGEIVKFEQTEIDLGKVKKGSIVTNKYVFTNISDQDIEIDLVSTCECTEAKWTLSEIPPGGQGEISFSFDSNKKDVVEPVDVDVYFININPKTDSPYSIYLQYTYAFE